MHRILNFGDIELDAKKSPLALLAQTCSSIGKPESGSKPIIPPLEKKDVPSASGSNASDKKEGASSSSSSSGGKSTPDRGSPSSRRDAVLRVASRDGDAKSSRAASTSPASSPNHGSAPPPFRPYGTPKSDDAEKKDEVATALTASFRTPRSASGASSGAKEKASPTGAAESSPTSDSSDAGGSSSSSGAISSSSSSSSYPQSSSVPSTTSSKLTEAEKGGPASPKPPGASALAGLASAQAAGYSSLYPYGPMFDPSSPAFQAAMAMHGGLLGHPSYLKSAASAHGAPHHPPCPHPGGCTQCDSAYAATAASVAASAASAAGYPHPSLNLHHSAAAAAAAAALGLPYPFLPPGGLPPPPSALATTSSSPFGSPYSSLNSQANSRLPFICNWVMPHDSFCGKRFATSEELLQHLRTHTSAANAAASEAAAAAAAAAGSSSLLNSPYPGFPSAAALAAAGLPGGLSAHGAAAAAAAAAALSSSALSSPNSPLRRTYPTSLSPVSRYHPYKPSVSSVPPGAPPSAPPPFAGLPHFPGLGPYYSPYANLYGPRLGAPVAPP